MSYFTWAVITAIIWGIVPVLEKVGLTRMSPLAGLFYRCLGVSLGLLFLGFGFLKPQEIKAVSMRPALLMVLAGFLASFVGQFCFYNGLKIGEVSRVVLIAGSFPVIAFLIGALLLKESINVIKIVGVLLVIAGIWAIRTG